MSRVLSHRLRVQKGHCHNVFILPHKPESGSRAVVYSTRTKTNKTSKGYRKPLTKPRHWQSGVSIKGCESLQYLPLLGVFV